MNKSEEFNEDILGRYINPEKIEKAPLGFTERILTRIQAEKVPFADRNSSIKNYKVPIISGLITVSLIISAILASSTGSDSAIFSVLKPFSDIRIALSEINFEKFTDFTLPGWMIYIALGIFMLSIFDLALNIIFHRERK
jgi:hypothetical protein